MPFSATYPLVENLFVSNAKVMDFGCGAGEFLQQVGNRICEGIGVDLDERLVNEASKCNRHPHVRYVKADARIGLPFEPGQFDIISAFGVLEHVGPEQSFIREFHRLLRPNGRLIIDVPSNGLFRAFDIGNVKYDFPRLHRWFYYNVARERKHYEESFGPDAAMFGQFSKEASRHKHYSARDLAAVVSPWFAMEHHKYYGLFFELIQFIQVLACRPFGRHSSELFSWLLTQDCKIISPIGCANIVAVFRKNDDGIRVS
jgi:SAM-dependent methyltransferase